MIAVRLLELSNPCIVLVAIKVSQGKLAVRPLERYWPSCDWDKLARWMLEAAEKYPSVLEHVKITWLIDGASRVFTHQLVRHRIASYTQESQRYSEYRIAKCLECVSELYCSQRGCDEERAIDMFNTNPWLWWSYALNGAEDVPESYNCLRDCFVMSSVAAVPYYQALKAYAHLRAEGYPAEEARYVLPQAARTAILVTMNLREFLHVYRLRASPSAQPETRMVVEKMMEELEKRLPLARELARRYRV